MDKFVVVEDEHGNEYVRINPSFLGEEVEEEVIDEDYVVYPSKEDFSRECFLGDRLDFTKLNLEEAKYCKSIFYTQFGFEALKKFKDRITDYFILDSKNKVKRIKSYDQVNSDIDKTITKENRDHIGYTEDGKEIKFNPALHMVGFWIDVFGLPYEMDSNEFLNYVYLSNSIKDNYSNIIFRIDNFLCEAIKDNSKKDIKHKIILHLYSNLKRNNPYYNRFAFIEICRKTFDRMEFKKLNWSEIAILLEPVDVNLLNKFE